MTLYCLRILVQIDVKQGIWGGMIFGGTAIQTVILAVITIRRNWEKEVYGQFNLI